MIVHARANCVPARVIVCAVKADTKIITPAAVTTRHVCVEIFSFADQFGAKSHSTPPPAVHPVCVAEELEA